jgi:hypothetical protein
VFLFTFGIAPSDLARSAKLTPPAASSVLNAFPTTLHDVDVAALAVLATPATERASAPAVRATKPLRDSAFIFLPCWRSGQSSEESLPSRKAKLVSTQVSNNAKVAKFDNDLNEMNLYSSIHP